MSRRVVPLTLDRLDELPKRCRKCVFWELDPLASTRAEEMGDTAFEKEAWVSSTLLEWGSCGLIAHVDQVPAGFALFAPPAFIPRSLSFPTSPVSGDALLLAQVHVEPRFRGGGIGRLLVQSVVKEAVRRGFRAVEAFGDARAPDDVLKESGCVVPADFLSLLGFKTVRPHHAWPRLRLETRSTVSWRAEVEVALERILNAAVPVGARPGGVRPSGVQRGAPAHEELT